MSSTGPNARRRLDLRPATRPARPRPAPPAAASGFTGRPGPLCFSAGSSATVGGAGGAMRGTVMGTTGSEGAGTASRFGGAAVLISTPAGPRGGVGGGGATGGGTVVVVVSGGGFSAGRTTMATSAVAWLPWLSLIRYVKPSEPVECSAGAYRNEPSWFNSSFPWSTFLTTDSPSLSPSGSTSLVRTPGAGTVRLTSWRNW